MELGVEYDPDFGGGSEEDLPPKWQEAALKNVNDDPHLRQGRMVKFRAILKEKSIELFPGRRK